jgi:hypothetical protein
MYPTLKDFAPQLKVFYNKQFYPGSWSGIDKHGNDRELLKMDYEDLPYAVREWIKKNEKQRFFSVQDGVVFFAPGAIYPILPLWVEEVQDGGVGGECEGKFCLSSCLSDFLDANRCLGLFEDLEIYSAEAKDGAVIAKVEHKSTGKNSIEFTVEAMQVKTKAEQQKDEL